MGFQWHGKAVLQKVEAKVDRNLTKAALLVVRTVKDSFGSPPPEPRKHGGGFKRNSSKKWKRGHPSRPGMPPHIQTGTLKRSISYDAPSKCHRRIGSTLQAQGGEGTHSYAWYLEHGTKRMAARPYLRPALRRKRKEILAIIAKG